MKTILFNYLCITLSYVCSLTAQELPEEHMDSEAISITGIVRQQLETGIKDLQKFNNLIQTDGDTYFPFKNEKKTLPFFNFATPIEQFFNETEKIKNQLTLPKQYKVLWIYAVAENYWMMIWSDGAYLTCHKIKYKQPQFVAQYQLSVKLTEEASQALLQVMQDYRRLNQHKNISLTEVECSFVLKALEGVTGNLEGDSISVYGCHSHLFGLMCDVLTFDQRNAKGSENSEHVFVSPAGEICSLFDWLAAYFDSWIAEGNPTMSDEDLNQGLLSIIKEINRFTVYRNLLQNKPAHTPIDKKLLDQWAAEDQAENQREEEKIDPFGDGES